MRYVEVVHQLAGGHTSASPAEATELEPSADDDGIRGHGYEGSHPEQGCGEPRQGNP